MAIWSYLFRLSENFKLALTPTNTSNVDGEFKYWDIELKFLMRTDLAPKVKEVF